MLPIEISKKQKGTLFKVNSKSTLCTEMSSEPEELVVGGTYCKFKYAPALQMLSYFSAQSTSPLPPRAGCICD